MKFVKTRDLKPGMRLAKPIYNKLGVLLFERNSKLNSQGIENIKNFDLIGIYILEPAEPVPPLSDEDIAFEQFQTISMFQLRTCMEQILNDEKPTGLNELVQKIIMNYGSLDHKLNFTQNIRSSEDYTYKHAISTAILTAMLTNILKIPYEAKVSCVTAALLYDIGYLYVSPDIMEKGLNLTPEEQKRINECRKAGFVKLAPKERGFLDKSTLKMISQIIYITDSLIPNSTEKIALLSGTKILKVADSFDRLTAMNLNQEPVSEVVAIKYLIEHGETFDLGVVRALSTCINILPTGCCIDLSSNEKAMVIMENSVNFLQPLILKFSDNMIYDLSDPKVFKEIQVQDIMKTMDNRILIDEETLKQFYADDGIKKATAKFHRKKEELVKKGRYGNGAKPARKMKLK